MLSMDYDDVTQFMITSLKWIITFYKVYKEYGF